MGVCLLWSAELHTLQFCVPAALCCKNKVHWFSLWEIVFTFNCFYFLIHSLSISQKCQTSGKFAPHCRIYLHLRKTPYCGFVTQILCIYKKTFKHIYIYSFTVQHYFCICIIHQSQRKRRVSNIFNISCMSDAQSAGGQHEGYSFLHQTVWVVRVGLKFKKSSLWFIVCIVLWINMYW